LVASSQPEQVGIFSQSLALLAKCAPPSSKVRNMSAQNYSPSSSFAPDRVWGIVFIVVYGLMLLGFGLIILGIGAAISFAGSSHSPLPSLFGAAFAGVLAIILLASVGAHIVGAIGIHQSRAWGFWATIILSIISLLSSSGGTCLTIIPLVYSILRLSGSYGPKPI
jgi:hypothetical protein